MRGVERAKRARKRGVGEGSCPGGGREKNGAKVDWARGGKELLIWWGYTRKVT